MRKEVQRVRKAFDESAVRRAGADPNRRGYTVTQRVRAEEHALKVMAQPHILVGYYIGVNAAGDYRKFDRQTGLDLGAAS